MGWMEACEREREGTKKIGLWEIWSWIKKGNFLLTILLCKFDVVVLSNEFCV